MDADDRASWFGITLTGEPLGLDEDLAGLSADLDGLLEDLRWYEHESDKPPEPPMADPE